jgi:hypothetical protein
LYFAAEMSNRTKQQVIMGGVGPMIANMMKKAKWIDAASGTTELYGTSLAAKQLCLLWRTL